ncbi:glutaredoxin domain-containing protein [Bacillus sp. N1-1]|jgi:arsenate reductase-like glutaredoxin family protein|uniref:glutaredoxin family protein n=1 Tax=Bacillus sp. N1-1 TaxID=2682541 RepID=UPI001316CFFA|nr:glutaredoxin domain-containing protein [Bacillus sp. N1-1]QHA92000.1 hypothetical protein GNK04_11520 [Bacillus sp. N1-1]
MEQIKLYTITSCMEWLKTKQQLGLKNVPFEEVNILEQPERLEELIRLAGELYVPF